VPPSPTQGFYLEDLSVGQSARRTFHVASADIDAFAAVSHDHNPVHVDETYAAKTPFGGRVVHGMLLGGYISACLASDLPGPGAIYVSQALRFKKPVRPGDAVEICLEITDIGEKTGVVTLSTKVLVVGKRVADGEAQVIVPRRASEVS
jgi:3-hydroxybutyryl-CoA dehydratase